MISVSWIEFQKIDGECRQDTHSTHICAVQFVHKRGTRTQRAWLKNCIVIFVRFKRIWSSGVFHVSSLVDSLAVHHKHFMCLTHSSFCDTRTCSTIGTTRATPRTPSTSRTSPSSQSTSGAIKNHSGVKTCRVAETRAPQLPQVMSPKSLRLSQGSKLFLEIHINFMIACTKWEK